jgi:hypothetical protein
VNARTRLADAAEGSDGGSLTTEYPANGSSFLNTQCVKEEANDRRTASGFRLGASGASLKFKVESKEPLGVSSRLGQATKSVR